MTETITSTDIKIGDSVTFVDPKSRRHPAIITAVWGYASKEAQDQHNRDYFERNKDTSEYVNESWLEAALKMEWRMPSVNLVYVDSDESKTDSYGRQIARSTSVVHQSAQPAHGFYWE